MVSPSRLARQREIIEVVLSHGWEYMRQLLMGGKTDEPDIPPPAVLVNILTDLGPVYIKLGQLLSTRPDLLPPAYIEALSSLQSMVPAVSAEQAEAQIRRFLPQPVEAVFDTVDYQAIAAGSIAQTHRAVLKNGKPIALKVRRPGIEQQVDRDMALIRDIARLMSATQFGQRYNLVDLAEEFADALTAELDFTQEASYTDQLRRNLAQSTWYNPQQLVVPQVYWDLTSPSLLALEWLAGVPLLQARQPGESPPVSSAEVTTLLFRVFFKQYFVDGFFHADPHPGNIFYLQDGRIALLDCGMMGRLDPRSRSTLTELVLAIVNCDAQRCTQLTLQLAEPLQPVNLARLESDYTRLLGRYYGLSLEQLNTAEMFGAILATGLRNHLRWPANIGLFTKSLANLEGAARQFNPEVNLIEEVRPLMADLFRHQLVGDDPLQALLRTALEFRNLSLSSPRQFSFLLDRLSSEQLTWNLSLRGLDDLRRSVDDAANRRSFSTVVGALIIGAAIVTTGRQSAQAQVLAVGLFVAASLLGLWLVYSIWRSGRLR
ncbi:MAG: AarF/ABC1/UbiB kinase family protein [Cyanobacteria bacterium REEB459]|nr:AarF/ABC1/UbiB kinase family protein [Cyanobacteria bacterium REEB459]